jgi:NCS1 family nucleobase:cation symporter-1
MMVTKATETKSELITRLSDTLNPIPAEARQVNYWEYILMWLAGCVFIGYFMLGASLIPPVGRLNLTQAFVAMVVSMIVVAVMYTLNGMPGHKYGIPMAVQLRASFGYSGCKIPALIRATPAIFWYGIQTWIGALALNGILKALVGYENIVLVFALFLILQIVLSMAGFQSIKWVEVIGAIFLIFAFVWMASQIVGQFGLQLEERIIRIPGTWGRPFWVGVMAFIAIYTTLMLNIGDYTRYVDRRIRPKGLFWAHLLGILPATIFMAGIGLIAAGATGEWNPIDVLVMYMPTTSVLVISLFFIVAAQFTTNLMLNVVPPANAFMEVFGWKWSVSCLVAGGLVLLTFPWYIVTAEGFFLYMQIYSVFLGPIFGIMVVDYWLIRKGRLNLPTLYDKDGPFTYVKGFNPAAIIALVVGFLMALIDIELSWYIGTPSAAIAYYLLMKYWIIKDFPPDETDVEDLAA